MKNINSRAGTIKKFIGRSREITVLNELYSDFIERNDILIEKSV